MRIPLRPTVTPRVVEKPPPEPEPVEVEKVEEDAVVAVTARYLFWRALFWVLMAFGVQTFASLMPETVETYYSQNFYHYLVRWLSLVNKFVQISLGELLIVGIIGVYVVWTVWYVGRALRREASIIEVFKVLFLQWAWLVAIGFALFLLMWGLNYQRMPIAERLDLERRGEGREEIISVGRRIVDGVNLNYPARDLQLAPGSTQLGLSLPKLHQAIETGFQQEAMLGPASQGGLAEPKPLYFSNVATLLDIRGVYIPYTGEATYNVQVPACDLPFTLAHVKAHQRGYAREDEANFIAYVVCIKSPESYVRYSGYLHGLKLLDFLARSDPQTAQALKTQILPGPMVDMLARESFGPRSRSEAVTPFVNGVINVYLRANRIRGGLKNFSEDTPLIVNYMLKNSVPESSSRLSQ